MRFIYGIFLLAFLGAIGVFAYQNQQAVALKFLDYSISSTMAIVSLAIYFLGMISGWTFVRMVTRSLHRVSDQNR